MNVIEILSFTMVYWRTARSAKRCAGGATFSAPKDVYLFVGTTVECTSISTVLQMGLLRRV
jgi:hypothetical protein